MTVRVLLAELGYAALVETLDDKSLKAWKRADRDALLTLLKEAGVSKVGHRLKLASAVADEQDAPNGGTLDASPFILAPAFDGAKSGYVFKRGSEGLGYYADDVPRSSPGAGAAKGSVPPAPPPALPAAPAAPTAPAPKALPNPPAIHGASAPIAPKPLVKAWFKVVPSAIKVREAPSLDATALGVKRQGELFEADAEHEGWVRLKEPVPSGHVVWALVDGARLNLGRLLERVPASSRLMREETENETKVPMSYVDSWVDDMV